MRKAIKVLCCWIFNVFLQMQILPSSILLQCPGKLNSSVDYIKYITGSSCLWLQVMFSPWGTLVIEQRMKGEWDQSIYFNISLPAELLQVSYPSTEALIRWPFLHFLYISSTVTTPSPLPACLYVIRAPPLATHTHTNMSVTDLPFELSLHVVYTIVNYPFVKVS